MYVQNENMVDFIIPLVIATKDISNNNYVYGQLIGTGFLIGSNGFGLTAAHVIDQLIEAKKVDDVIVGLFQNPPNWYSFEITLLEKHPTDDVGIFKIAEGNWKSIFNITSMREYSSCEYHCWGYPREEANELKKLHENAGEYPELIFTQGYVRRSLFRELYPKMIFKGNKFYELSEIVGNGNSGAPVILKKTIGKDKWGVFGIYIGENEKVGYAVSSEAFFNWSPEILGKTIIEESNS